MPQTSPAWSASKRPMVPRVSAFFFACEAGCFFDFVIDLDGLLRFELEEGPGGQLEGQVPECFLDEFFPVHMPWFFSEDQRCFFAIDVLQDRFNLRLLVIFAIYCSFFGRSLVDVIMTALKKVPDPRSFKALANGGAGTYFFKVHTTYLEQAICT
jgi:hypothetical protein